MRIAAILMMLVGTNPLFAVETAYAIRTNQIKFDFGQGGQPTELFFLFKLATLKTPTPLSPQVQLVLRQMFPTPQEIRLCHGVADPDHHLLRRTKGELNLMWSR